MLTPFFYTFTSRPPRSTSLPYSVTSEWDDLTQWAEEAFNLTRESLAPQQSFPPFNAFQLEDGSLFLEFAFAGYKKGDIELSFEGDVLKLQSKGASRKVDGKDHREIKRGLKLSKFDVSYSLAPDRFDTKNPVAKFEDGILSITLPLAEAKKPNKVKIQ